MIRLEQVKIKSGTFELNDITFSVPNGEYGVLIGKTGTGKTSILEVICGIKSIKAGQILINNNRVDNLRPGERDIGYVPQDGALFSHLTVFENIAFSLRLRQWSNEDIKNRVAELCQLLGLENLIKRSTNNLSGGEKQRVCLARALAFYPKVLCLDEPLSALDEETHHEMCKLLKDIHQKTNTTFLHITHNLREVKLLSTSTFQLSNFKLVKLDNSNFESK